MPAAKKPPSSPRLPTDRALAIYRRVVIEGRPRDAVAAELALRPDQVTRTIREVERRLARRQFFQPAGRASALHLERLEHQWCEVMEAWRQSKAAQEVTKVSTDSQGRRKAEHTRRAQTGDVRYLDQARRILADIRLVLRAAGQAASPEQDDALALTVDQRTAALDRLLETLRDRAGADPAVEPDRRPAAAAVDPGGP